MVLSNLICKGDHLRVRLAGNAVEMVPAQAVPKDQLWFWAPEWQAKEREADKDIAQGRVKEFESGEDLMKDLES